MSTTSKITSTFAVGMTISQFDSQIPRHGGRGASARTGHVAYLVARGQKHDYDAQIVSAHRKSAAAIAACREGMTAWAWDSYMGGSGGYRSI